MKSYDPTPLRLTRRGENARDIVVALLILAALIVGGWL